MQHKQWDIFCQVIDNFGDIGVAWRLARQLANVHAIPVRLWIDDLTVFHRLCPQSRPDVCTQMCKGVEIHAWDEPFAPVTPAAVVIEAFGCRLPQNYLHAMSQLATQPVWINLEYLSAEAWVRTHHGLASPHPSLPLTKYFFFPGYQLGTGGVLQEHDLLETRAQFQRVEQPAFRQRAGVAHRPDALFISMFAYENAALPDLLDTWLQQSQPIVCLIPEGKIVPQIAAWLGVSDFPTGAVRLRAHLEFHVLPFMEQDDYDRLLWACDINFVRGEDSCVRAQWAARPFVWQAYPQEQEAHWAKLDALSKRYTAGLLTAAAQAITPMWQAWNGRGDIGLAWAEFLSMKSALDIHAQQWPEQLARPGDLVSNLLAFVEAHQAG
ncbi:MAG: elongation factor P maturation arginine rhamnosyltransferase EarP [Thiobacillus sp.]